MAYLKKDGRNGSWYIIEKIWDDGKWKNKWMRLGKITGVEARACLARYIAQDKKLRLGLETSKKTSIKLKTIIDEYTAFQNRTPTKSQKTIKTEKGLLSIFGRRFGDELAHSVPHEKVMEWFREKDYDPKTIRHYLNALSQTYNLAMERGRVAHNPLKKVKRPKLIPKPPKAVKEEGVVRVFAEIAEDRRAPFELMFYAGLRPSEAFSLKVKNINLTKKHIDLYPDQTKTAERGIIPIHSALVPVLERLTSNRGQDDYLFPWGNSHQKEAKKTLKTACKKAGVNITPYQLRHTFATRLLEKTGDIRVVQQLLRHKSILMTTRYATALDEALRDAIDKL